MEKQDVRVFSDSVFFVRFHNSIANQAWATSSLKYWTRRHPWSCHTAIQIMREIQTFAGPTEPCDFKGRIIFQSMFNDTEHGIKDNQLHMSRKRNRSYRMRQAIQVRLLVFLSTWTRKNMVSYLLKRFYCAEPFLEGDFKSKKGKQTIHFQSSTQAKTMIIRTLLLCNQFCIPAGECVCVWFDQYNRNKEAFHREEPELSTDDLTNLTHRKDLTASECETVKTAKPLLKCHKREVSHQTLAKASTLWIKNEDRWTLVCREYTLPRSNPNSKLVCAGCDSVRIGLVLDIHFILILVPSKNDLHSFFMGTHQQWFKSIHLSDTRFGATRCRRSSSSLL